MRLIMRLAGLVLLTTTLVLMVTDGIRTLAANSLVLTSLGASWRQADAASLSTAQQFVTAHSAPFIWNTLWVTVLGWPGFIVTGIPAILLIAAGWSRRRRKTRLQAL